MSSSDKPPAYVSPGRYSASSGSSPTPSAIDERTIGKLQEQLKSQGREIGEIKQTLKDDLGNITRTVSEMKTETIQAVTQIKTQMGHLVTKEMCLEGRKELAESLKSRMDGEREITGMNIKLPELWQKAMAYDPKLDVPKKIRDEIDNLPSSTRTRTGPARKERPLSWWITFFAAILTLIGALFGGTAFVVKTLEQQQQQDDLLREILKNSKQPPALPTHSKNVKTAPLQKSVAKR